MRFFKREKNISHYKKEFFLSKNSVIAAFVFLPRANLLFYYYWFIFYKNSIAVLPHVYIETSMGQNFNYFAEEV